jgi:ATP-dependent exoDNAse (exonuclease V) alpha subunit
VNKAEHQLFEQYSHLAYDRQGKFDLSLFGEKQTNLNICATNAKIIQINRKWMDKCKPENDNDWMVCKATEAALRDHCQDIICYSGLPVIARRTRVSDKFYNGEMWRVDSFDNKEINLISDDTDQREITVCKKEFASLFRPAYAISAHKAQGQTLRREFTIWKWSLMTNRHRYVAVSRGTVLGHVNIVRE